MVNWTRITLGLQLVLALTLALVLSQELTAGGAVDLTGSVAVFLTLHLLNTARRAARSSVRETGRHVWGQHIQARSADQETAHV